MVERPKRRALSGRLVFDVESLPRTQAFEHGLLYVVADRRAGSLPIPRPDSRNLGIGLRRFSGR